MQGNFFKYVLAAIVLGILVLMGAHLFGQKESANASEEVQGGSPPAMEVEVSVISPQQIQLWKSFSGHVIAVDQAQIRPQVSGRITEIRFEDGQHAKKGDVLIVIDPRPYQAKLNQAKALLEAAQTQADLAEKEYQRATKLINSDAISQRMLDERTNSRQAATAAVQGATAAVESAKIDMDYAYVKAPIDGKISRAEITEGNLVQAGPNAPILTSIVSDEKVYVDFEVDERTYINSVKNAGNNNLPEIPVKLHLLKTDYEKKGMVYSFDNHIDQASGTIRARAIFDNQDGALLPGMSVTILMGSADDSNVILVSERAIGTDQDRKFVYVIGEDGTAQYREVEIGESVNGERSILSGLEAGEQVITEGLVHVRPGMAVSPKVVLKDNETPSLDEQSPVEADGQENSGKE